jgi:hypothetical protein
MTDDPIATIDEDNPVYQTDKEKRETAFTSWVEYAGMNLCIGTLIDIATKKAGMARRLGVPDTDMERWEQRLRDLYRH